MKPYELLGQLFRRQSSLLNARTVRAEDVDRLRHRCGSIQVRLDDIRRQVTVLEEELGLD